MYRYEWTPEAKRQLKKLSPKIQRIIIKKLDYYVSTGQPLVLADYLTNFRLGQHRFRIGVWRVVFDVVEEAMVIHAVGHRREIYL